MLGSEGFAAFSTKPRRVLWISLVTSGIVIVVHYHTLRMATLAHILSMLALTLHTTAFIGFFFVGILFPEGLDELPKVDGALTFLAFGGGVAIGENKGKGQEVETKMRDPSSKSYTFKLFA